MEDAPTFTIKLGGYPSCVLPDNGVKKDVMDRCFVLPPEAMDDAPFASNWDSWSVGMIALVLHLGRLPTYYRTHLPKEEVKDAAILEECYAVASDAACELAEAMKHACFESLTDGAELPIELRSWLHDCLTCVEKKFAIGALPQKHPSLQTCMHSDALVPAFLLFFRFFLCGPNTPKWAQISQPSFSYYHFAI